MATVELYVAAVFRNGYEFGEFVGTLTIVGRAQDGYLRDHLDDDGIDEFFDTYIANSSNSIVIVNVRTNGIVPCTAFSNEVFENLRKDICLPGGLPDILEEL